MWFECIGVVSGCCCKVYRYPNNSYCSFFAAASLATCLFILKCIFVLYNHRIGIDSISRDERDSPLT